MSLRAKVTLGNPRRNLQQTPHTRNHVEESSWRHHPVRHYAHNVTDFINLTSLTPFQKAKSHVFMEQATYDSFFPSIYKTVFTKLKYTGNNRVNAPQLLRYAYFLTYIFVSPANSEMVSWRRSRPFPSTSFSIHNSYPCHSKPPTKTINRR